MMDTGRYGVWGTEIMMTAGWKPVGFDDDMMEFRVLSFELMMNRAADGQKLTWCCGVRRALLTP